MKQLKPCQSLAGNHSCCMRLRVISESRTTWIPEASSDRQMPKGRRAVQTKHSHSRVPQLLLAAVALVPLGILKMVKSAHLRSSVARKALNLCSSSLQAGQGAVPMLSRSASSTDIRIRLPPLVLIADARDFTLRDLGTLSQHALVWNVRSPLSSRAARPATRSS
jgi:hypothetical protein